MKSKEWTTGEPKKSCVTNCDWAENRQTIIYLSPEVVSVIRRLCDEIECEWQMLLSGYEAENVVYVTGYYIPKQEVSYGSVKNVDCITEKFCKTNKIVATIHSHANMNTFFSSTDEESTNETAFIRHHIVTNNDGKYEAVSRIELPCKEEAFVESTVKMQLPTTVNIEGIENITEARYTPPVSRRAQDDIDALGDCGSLIPYPTGYGNQHPTKFDECEY